MCHAREHLPGFFHAIFPTWDALLFSTFYIWPCFKTEFKYRFLCPCGRGESSGLKAGSALLQVQVRHSLDVSGPISVFVSWKAEWGDLAPLQAIACTFHYFPRPLHPPSQTFHNPIHGKLSLEIKASIFLLWDSLYTHTDTHTWKHSECCSVTEWLNK